MSLSTTDENVLDEQPEELQPVEPAATAAPADLNRRLYKALTAGKEELFEALTDPALDVIVNVLQNPALDENHLLVLLKRRDLPEELIRKIYRHQIAEGSHRVKLALVHNPATSTAIRLTLIPHLYLFELVTICYLPGVTPDQKLAAERAIIQRLPTTPLGNKIALARRGTGPVVAELMKMEAANPMVVEACLANPHLREAAVHQLVSSGNVTAETISMVARHDRWKSRPNLQLAMLKNHRTPPVWFTLWLPRMKTADLQKLAISGRLNPQQRHELEAEMAKRKK